MSSVLDPDSRLGYGGDLQSVIEHAAAYFGIGRPARLKHLAAGYEDCNIQIRANSGVYALKLFADNQLGDYGKTRRGNDVAQRLVDIVRAVKANHANAPELLKGEDYLYHEDGLVALCYHWIEGRTYYDLDRAPTVPELERIIEQAARINTTSLQPVYYHDIWAVPHIDALMAKVKPHLATDDIALMSEILKRFHAINLEELPKCLVHGDLTKGNVLLGERDTPFVIDFSVTNWTARIIELALIISNLMYAKEDHRTLQEKAENVAYIYQKYNKLTSQEVGALADVSLAGAAMEFLGSVWRQEFFNDASDETEYWLELGRATITRELKAQQQS